LRTIHANSNISAEADPGRGSTTAQAKLPGHLVSVGHWIDGAAACNARRSAMSAPNDSFSPSRLRIKRDPSRDWPRQLSRTAAPDEPVRARAYSEKRWTINPVGAQPARRQSRRGCAQPAPIPNGYGRSPAAPACGHSRRDWLSHRLREPGSVQGRGSTPPAAA